jgi:hypothetical protein
VLKYSSQLFPVCWRIGWSFIAAMIINPVLLLQLDVINKEYICFDIFIFAKDNEDINLSC